MPDFEVYTSQVPVEPTAAAPVARDTVGNELAKALEGVGSALTQKALRTRKEIKLAKAAELGQEEGAMPGFKIKEPTSEEDLVRNRAAIQSQKLVIQNDIRSKVLGITSDTLSNSNLNSLNEYDGKLKNYSNTLLPTVPKQLQGYARNMVNYYGITHRQPVANEVESLHRNVVNSNLQLSVNNNLRDASMAAYSGNQVAAKTLQANVHKSLDSALATGYITSAYHANTIDSFDKNLKYSRYLGDFNKSILKGTANDAFSSFINNKQPDLDFKEKRLLTDNFKRMMLDHKQSIQAQYGNINQQVKDLSTSIYLNGSNPATEGKVVKMKSIIDSFYPDDKSKADNLKGALDFAKERHNYIQSIKYLPENTIKVSLAEKYSELKKKPTEKNLADYTQLVRDSGMMLRNRKENLYDIASMHPAVVGATAAQRNANQANVSISSGNKLGSATKASIQDRDENMIQIERQMGTPQDKLQIISPEDLQVLATNVTNADPEKSIGAIRAVLLQHINHPNIAMQQIQKVVPSANISMLNAAVNPETTAHSPYMFQAMQNKTKDLEGLFDKTDIVGMKDTVRDEVMKDYGAAILNRNGDPTKLLNSQLDFAYKTALSYKANGIPNPEKQAVNDTLLAHTQHGTYNGKDFIIPKSKEYTPDTVINASNAILNEIDAVKLKVPANFYPGLQDERRSDLYKKFLISDAYPSMITDNSGIQMLDAARVPVKTIDGNVLSFKFDDLLNPKSEVNQLIHKDRKAQIETPKFALSILEGNY